MYEPVDEGQIYRNESHERLGEEEAKRLCEHRTEEESCEAHYAAEPGRTAPTEAILTDEAAHRGRQHGSFRMFMLKIQVAGPRVGPSKRSANSAPAIVMGDSGKIPAQKWHSMTVWTFVAAVTPREKMAKPRIPEKMTPRRPFCSETWAQKTASLPWRFLVRSPDDYQAQACPPYQHGNGLCRKNGFGMGFVCRGGFRKRRMVAGIFGNVGISKTPWKLRTLNPMPTAINLPITVDVMAIVGCRIRTWRPSASIPAVYISQKVSLMTGARGPGGPQGVVLGLDHVVRQHPQRGDQQRVLCGDRHIGSSYLTNTRTLWMAAYTVIAVAGAVIIRQVDNSLIWARYSGYCLLSAYTVNFPLLLSMPRMLQGSPKKRPSTHYVSPVPVLSEKGDSNQDRRLSPTVQGTLSVPSSSEDESPSYPSGFALC
ncbi:predicted protein [Aspergillus nidulans FGSC A4]|uniref:MFS allantoate transporter, putative (AFU_orthologue AFUA_6G03720) n=1 Tax=Emericella nidulans (strain FGSC A4 / ATCC 38163 / CBS 112.46 / NRRL 194 / M139) TaxID=227321 RepID=Q5BA27_EMENI|nr:hypothetical protein [Aspergillus nidulans FGSC A4]EAA64708.1 predicted protein [Aspergillus nidulans FGSC A4]CBF87181.1 TPA: MFS allantoate transporter, putative (AFU_orthologue; AFUA_6G03720) [Aspergillus nidulans FGSC A4]|eukprot:XP_660207.1 predicted protein [Aspergillus nidulans FGSC A4]